MATENETFIGECQYFALCSNPATVTIPNPILGPVPACEECAGRYQRMSGRA